MVPLLLTSIMIRIKTIEGWILLGHKDHAHLAGAFAEKWDDEKFPRPRPLDSVLKAVFHHDDSWEERDDEGYLTSEGLPSAFTKELVGTYDAFEEIELEDYLNVRAGATEKMAMKDPYAAILISMHTVNLLTEQADLSTLNAAETALHSEFIDGQLKRQKELAAMYADSTGDHSAIAEPVLKRAFEFLQACDSLSLITCVRFEDKIPLRHRHPDTSGELHEFHCQPLGNDTYHLSPFPFEGSSATFEVSCKQVEGERYGNLKMFRDLYHKAPKETFTITLVSNA